MDGPAVTLLSTICILAMVSAVVFLAYFKREKGKDWVYTVYFLTVLISGITLHSVGISYTSSDPGMFILGKAIDATVRSFGGVFNTSGIKALADANTVFAASIFAHYISSVGLTTMVAIKLFGRNAVNRIRVMINSQRSKYIVVGAGGQAELFLKNLSTAKKRVTTVILETKESGKKNDLMNNGFSVLVVKNDRSRSNGAYGKEDIYRDVREAMTIAGLEKNRNDTKIIAMSEDDEFNLLIAKIVTDHISGIVRPVKNDRGRIDKLTKEQEVSLSSMKLNAHIMYSHIDRTEHFSFIEYALGRVTFFNASEIRARKFMLENPITMLIPPHWINKEKARLYGAGDKGHEREYRIGNIFVGFGADGKQLLRKSICDHQILGTDYNALIIDKDANGKEKQFKNSAPGLFDRTDGKRTIFGAELRPNADGSVYFEQTKERHNITFADINVLSADFYQRIVDEIEGTRNGEDGKKGYDLVSVIIALENDKLGIETALELRQKLYERGLLKVRDGEKEYDRVRMFVKMIRDGVISDGNLINDKKGIDTEIVTFGADAEVLTEGYIIRKELDVIARRIADEYWAVTDSNETITNIVTKWDSLTEFKRDSNRYAAMSIRMKLNLLGFDMRDKGPGVSDKKAEERYKERYGIATAERLRNERQDAERSGGEFIDLMERDANGIIDNARNNLARLEHQRWVALHLVSGWTKLPKEYVTENVRQNEKSKQHACITTVEGLYDLQRAQTDPIIDKARKDNETDENIRKKENKALYGADTVCYDFDLMDRLLKTLDGSEFIIADDERHNSQ